jgi:hypothetical protein
MWAHYSDSHRGLCLEYDVDHATCLPVVYSAKQPVVESIPRHETGPAAGTLSINVHREARVFLTKSADWSYEQEYRIIRFAKDQASVGERAAAPGKLRGVYFGMRAPRTTLTIVERLLAHRPDVAFWQGSLRRGSYELVFTRLGRPVAGEA